MKKFELTLTSDYVRDWSVSDGVREIFQNAIDQQNNSGHNMKFEYDKDECTLIISNENAVLTTNTLLLGSTSKAFNDDSIGQFGEGYKIATLVLLRHNKNVVFYNNGANEIWRPRMVKSRRFNGENILTFFVEKNKTSDKDLVVKIYDISPEDYEQIEHDILQLQPPVESVDTIYGRILTDIEYSGNIYVNGLYVKHEQGMKYGYDILPKYLKINRDRKMVDTFDIQWVTSRIIVSSNNQDIIMESMRYTDAKYINHATSISNVDKSIVNAIYDNFRKEHGDKAIPVVYQSDIQEINDKYTDAVPVIVSESESVLIKSAPVYEVLAEEKANNELSIKERLENWLSNYEDLLHSDARDSLNEIIDDIVE